MRHGSLFSGIGGFDLAAEWMGWENVFHCEWMEFPRKVLDYYFPNADSHIDICKTDFQKYEGTIEIITGGFPCQPFSTAGKRKGTDDERYLWGEMLRAVQEIKPKFVIAENVFGITNIDGGLVFEQVCLDLETEGYEVQSFIIPSASKNAPHKRDRVWFIAYPKYLRCPQRQQQRQSRCEQRLFEGVCDNGNATDSNGTNNQTQSQKRILGQENKRRQTRRFINGNTRTQWNAFPTQSPICSGDDGLPTELDGITFSKWRAESIKGYGNAIVPQVAYELFKIISKLL
jgi:DNA (cytosine-5)-methyltransferase 1